MSGLPPTYHLEPTLCPVCGHVLNAATAAKLEDHAAPQPGDLTLCANCCEPLAFDDDLRPVKLPKEVRENLDPETRAELEKWAERLGAAPWRTKH